MLLFHDLRKKNLVILGFFLFIGRVQIVALTYIGGHLIPRFFFSGCLQSYKKGLTSSFLSSKSYFREGEKSLISELDF